METNGNFSLNFGVEIQDHLLWKAIIVVIKRVGDIHSGNILIVGCDGLRHTPIGSVHCKRHRLFLAGEKVKPGWSGILWILIPDILPPRQRRTASLYGIVTNA